MDTALILGVLNKLQRILPPENDGKFVQAYRKELLKLQWNLRISQDFIRAIAFSGKTIFVLNATKAKVMDIVFVVDRLLDQYSQIGLSPGDGVVVRCMKRGLQHLLGLRLHKYNQQLFKLVGVFLDLPDELWSFWMQQLIDFQEQFEELFEKITMLVNRIQQQHEQFIQQNKQLLQKTTMWLILIQQQDEEFFQQNEQFFQEIIMSLIRMRQNEDQFMTTMQPLISFIEQQISEIMSPLFLGPPMGCHLCKLNRKASET